MQIYWLQKSSNRFLVYVVFWSLRRYKRQTYIVNGSFSLDVFPSDEVYETSIKLFKLGIFTKYFKSMSFYNAHKFGIFNIRVYIWSPPYHSLEEFKSVSVNPILPCNCIKPNNKASAVGGQPGTYVSTGKILSQPLTTE